MSVHRGRGDGTFFPALSYLVGTNPYMAIAEDFNGDGSVDLAAINSTDNTVSVLLRTGCLP